VMEQRSMLSTYRERRFLSIKKLCEEVYLTPRNKAAVSH
jgi:hypothetical protein